MIIETITNNIELSDNARVRAVQLGEIAESLDDVELLKLISNISAILQQRKEQHYNPNTLRGGATHES